MDYESLDDWIEHEHGHHPSVADQKRVAHWFLSEEYLISAEKLIRTQAVGERIATELDHDVETCLDNLEELGILTEVEPDGGASLIKCERVDEIFFTPENDAFPPILAEEIARLLDDLTATDAERIAADGGDDTANRITVRTVAAEALDVDPEDVDEEILGTEDIVDRMEKYDDVVTAIKEHEAVERGGDYDEVGWRNRAHRWGLSRVAEQVATS